ncbi:tRNA pseudouridine(38-40) synthase TruA [Buchnera aphidicola]|uniref:tRNA pseudouridine synthase A n=1 Tax=Buchnera aphidicola subsp. Cinara cedri (strain Cc) TaxID=372461 RepID=Q057U4_BUCCC|nr:tRNA pseudouridine(38-40) synthase TruA [Buchnera aphidicola]ABJ90605.1 pseudouridylate synthase I [Buchnera aphidicola BCc]
MKFVFGVEYDGSIYHGWQKQKSVLTIQECIEHALSKIANSKIEVICAGRTDKGVHAITQIVHFSSLIIRNEEVWFTGLNSLLPKNITVLWLKKVSSNFHARFSALSRSYRYIIFNRKNRSSFLKNYYFHVRNFLDIYKMKTSSQFLIGNHDFSSFKSSGCQSFSSRKNIFSLIIYRINDFIIIDITANSFLYHMVRNIVGCLILVGLSKKKPEWVQYILQKKDIKKTYSTVPAQGLYFLFASYPDCFSILNQSFLLKKNNLFTHFFSNF